MPLRPVSAAADADLTARVHAILDSRLVRDAVHPVAIALSGGGDSMALLALAADWAAGRGRRLLALTVDHGLNPDSAGWSETAHRAAESLGAEWRGLSWTGDKPTTGLPAAARRARHALIAAAARAAGARVVLFAHTADDVAESALMQAGGSTLGTLRPWSPSPAWPEGQGLTLCRPLLYERRAVLRDYLTARGLGWIEDPANDDLKFGRSRARAALADAAPLSRIDPLRPATGPGPTVSDAGIVSLARTVDHRTLAMAIVCAGGGDSPPRGDRLDRLIGRLRAGEDFAAVLCGARAGADGADVTVMREAGEFARRPVPPLSLTPGVAGVWDGRFEIEAGEPGWSVVPATGRLSALSRDDRAALNTLPPSARGALPVLIRDGSAAPVLAWRMARVRALVGERLALALDQTTHEGDLAAAMHGATRSDPLFS
ncbi:MAG: tRNA lysidine(34) synthetase TilS [Pseudomonadota bacterium]